MKLLIVTQAVDRDDPILGFFHRWIEEFATRADHLIVVANGVGAHQLPSNVDVFSLGKEKGTIRGQRIFRFLGLLFSLRKNYDAVLVHMTPEHAVLAAPLLRLMGKRLFLWYNHPAHGFFLRLALPLVERVFYTSPESASAISPRSVRMPVGIDTKLFAPSSAVRDPGLIYMQGRIAASKRIDVALGAMRLLRARGTRARLKAVGPVAPGYGARLEKEFPDVFADDAAALLAPIPNYKTPAEYAKAAVSVNLAREGHFDKSALEAMACGTPTIVGSRTFKGLVPDEWIISDPDAPRLAAALERLFALSAAEREDMGIRLRDAVIREHGLAALADRLFAALEPERRGMDPKRFYDSVSPGKFGADYEKARWASSPSARAQYRMTADALRRVAFPLLAGARSVLELGPGPGTWTKLLMGENPGAVYTLVDISTEMLLQARAALPAEKVSFVESDWLVLSTARPYDFFFSSRAIEYVPDKDAAARIVARSLASGGRGVIVTKMPKPLFDRIRGRGTALHQGQVLPQVLAASLARAGLRVRGTTIVTATVPLLGSATMNRLAYRFLRPFSAAFPFSLFAESYAISFEKP